MADTGTSSNYAGLCCFYHFGIIYSILYNLLIVWQFYHSGGRSWAALNLAFITNVSSELEYIPDVRVAPAKYLLLQGLSYSTV